MTTCSSSTSIWVITSPGATCPGTGRRRLLAAFPMCKFSEFFFSWLSAHSHLLSRAHRRRRTPHRRANSTPAGSGCTTSGSTRHTGSSPPGNRAIRTIRWVRRQTPRPGCLPNWRAWALSNLNYLLTIPASKTAPSCGPIRPGRSSSFRRSPRRSGWRMRRCKNPASIPMPFSSSL